MLITSGLSGYKSCVLVEGVVTTLGKMLRFRWQRVQLGICFLKPRITISTRATELRIPRVFLGYRSSRCDVTSLMSFDREGKESKYVRRYEWWSSMSAVWAPSHTYASTFNWTYCETRSILSRRSRSLKKYTAFLTYGAVGTWVIYKRRCQNAAIYKQNLIEKVRNWTLHGYSFVYIVILGLKSRQKLCNAPSSFSRIIIKPFSLLFRVGTGCAWKRARSKRSFNFTIFGKMSDVSDVMQCFFLFRFVLVWNP